MRHWLCALLWCCLAPVINAQSTQGELVPAEKLFVEKIYPQFRAVQCHLCHNDNGVASDYELSFPTGNASRDQVLAFGYQLSDYLDRDNVDNSMLLLKPTGRVEHTGGVRILPGGADEENLRTWMKHLVSLSSAQRERADRLIEQARTWQREPLRLQRLTHSQYNNTVRDLLGDRSQPANQFPKEDFIRGFKNQAEGQGISPLLAEAYGQAAERLARAAFRGGDRNHLLPIQPQSSTDRLAAEAFVKRFGLRAFRRPLTQAEQDKYTQLLIKSADADNPSAIEGFTRV